MGEYALIELDIVDSTNNWAKREKASLSHDRPNFVVASGQTGGRGRGMNTWISPKGQNLYLTLAEKIRSSLKITDYALIAALAMKHLLNTLDIHARIKWPNDLIVGHEKICGILVEGTSVGSDPWAIVGIGLNVHMDESLLRSIDQPATSLHRLLSHPPTVHEIKGQAIEAICERLTLAQECPDKCREDYRSACEWMVGMNAVLQTPQEELEGIIEGFSEEGYIQLQTQFGRSITIPQAVMKKYTKRTQSEHPSQ
jgi:BirA family biotin operon repressor/biotin-[acetyl-CoA-carboxylase] ligase